MPMRWILGGILGVALVLRLAGVTYGLPLDVMGDEFVHLFTAFTMLDEMTLRVLSPLSYVPSLFAILTVPFIAAFGALGIVFGTFEGIAGFKEFAVINATDFLSIGRVLSALFGVAFIYLLYRIVRPLAGVWPALVVAAFAALDFWLVHESNRAHFWMPATTLLALAFYTLIRMAETGRPKYYWASVVSISFAFWMGFFPILLTPFFVLAHFHAQGRTFKPLIYPGAALLGFIMIISWLNPLSVFKQFGRAIRSILNVVGIDVLEQFGGPSDKATEPFQNLYFLFRTLIVDNPLMFVLGAVGLVLIAYNVGWRSIVVQLTLGFFVLYIAIAMFVWPHPDYRYMLPLLLPLLLGVAYAISVGYKKLHPRRSGVWVGAILLALMFGYSIYTTTGYVTLLQKDDTRILAREWIFEHVPDSAAVYTSTYYFDLPKSREAIIFYKQNLPEALRTKDDVLLGLPNERFPTPSYFVIDIESAQKLGEKTPKFDYIVAGYFKPERRIAIPPGFERIMEFYPTDPGGRIDDLIQTPRNPFIAVENVSRLGPHIEIYKRLE